MRDSALKAIKGSKIELHRKDWQGNGNVLAGISRHVKVKVKLFRQKGIWLVVMMSIEATTHGVEKKTRCTVHFSASLPVAAWIKLCRECFSKLPSSLSNQSPNDRQKT